MSYMRSDTITVRVTPEMCAELQALARRWESSVSQVIRQLLRESLSRRRGEE